MISTLGDFGRMVGPDFGLGFELLVARAAVTEGGSCRACLTASMSALVRVESGEWRRGGRGGAGDLESILNVARGGGVGDPVKSDEYKW